MMGMTGYAIRSILRQAQDDLRNGKYIIEIEIDNVKYRSKLIIE